jgi:hypothetical protein
MGQFQRILELSTQKIVNKLSKYGFGIRDPEKPIPDPGVKKAPDPGSRIRICTTYIICCFYIMFGMCVFKCGYFFRTTV